MKWTLDHIEHLHKTGKIRGYKINGKIPDKVKKKTRAKYHNEKVEYEGIMFDSRKEYNRYRELLLLLKAGKIGFLKLQVPYELNEGGTYSFKYYADFEYVDQETGKKITEDVKGFRTAVYRKKKKLMKKIYGIEIFET